jgi:hypothetical protein
MPDPPSRDDESIGFAERIRAACIEEAIRAYEQAGISGLCQEGRFEAVISALRMLPLETHPHGNY